MPRAPRDGPESPPAWDLARLMYEIQGGYREYKLTRDWSAEKRQVQARLAVIAEELSRRYVDPWAIGVGGSGIVLGVIEKQTSQKFAVKFPRPIDPQDKELCEMMGKEIGHLLKLRHSSIIHITGQGWLNTTGRGGKRFPYYVMDFVEGADSSVRLRQKKTVIPEAKFLRIVQRSVEALCHMHRQGIVHLDLKAQNIFIRDDEDLTPVLADLGTAKQLQPGDPGMTLIGTTLQNAALRLQSGARHGQKDPDRIRVQMPRGELDETLDHVPLGWVLIDWLGFDHQGKTRPTNVALSPYARKYLLLMAARLFGAEVEDWVAHRVGLNRHLIAEVAYHDLDHALQDIRKLSGSLVDDIPELNAYSPGTIQVGAGSSTTFTRRLEELMDHPVLRRLASISQLGPISLVYPTATHSRLEHVLGTYHLACQYVLSLYYDPLSPFFRQIIDSEDIRALLVAALLHDAGQFPMAHDLEEIEGPVPEPSQQIFSHKQMTAAILADVAGVKGKTAIALADILKKWGVTASKVAAILNAIPTGTACPLKDQLLHSIIDGPLDADKLDYLRRDSARLGLPYGADVDVDRMLRNLTVALPFPLSSGRPAAIGVHEKAKVPAELVIVTRYTMYTQVYWHHSVRAMKSMLSRAVLSLIADVEQREARGEKARSQLQEEFSRFTTSLPGSLYTRKRSHGPGYGTGEVASTIAPTDVAVIGFLHRRLKLAGVPEAELLKDLMARRLYKRLLVFSAEQDDNAWATIASAWDRLRTAGQRVGVLRRTEANLAEILARKASGAARGRSGRQGHRGLASSVTSGRPIILLDVPSPRLSAELPLKYVGEAQRRALKGDDRAVGEVSPNPSRVWGWFGEQMRGLAGNVRVLCRPDLVDFLTNALGPQAFMEAFREAAEAVTAK